MIDLNLLYSKVPSIAPGKNHRKRNNSATFNSKVYKKLNFSNEFREKLLQNLSVFLSTPLVSLSKDLDFYAKPKTDSKLDKELKKSLWIENKNYQNDISGKLKFTMPKFLESSKRKALRKLI